MDIGVVITALNHDGTIIESTESVLSQTRLPDQLGLALGPSLDATERMAEFYREEYDFIHFERKPEVSRRGLTHLRLESLKELETEYVLFLRGDSYLRHRVLERLEELRPGNKMLMGSVQYLDLDSETWNRPAPPEGSPETVLDHGPFVPGTVLWPREALVEQFSSLQVMNLGPFSTLGWLLLLLDRGWESETVEETFVETWDLRGGEACWTTSVFEALINLRHFTEDLDVSPVLRTKLGTTIGRLIQRQAPPVTYNPEGSSEEPLPWVDADVPLPE